MIHETQIVYLGLNDKGEDKMIREKYLVENRETFTEVEDILFGEFGARKEFDVIAIKRSRLMEIINTSNDGNKIFFATIVSYFIEDDDYKQTKYCVALFASDIQAAHTKIKEYMRQGLQDMELVKIAETKFLGVV